MLVGPSMEEAIHKDALKRRFVIGLSASGVVFIRDSEAGRDAEFAKYALPVYSTDTREEADMIVVRNCSLAYDNERYIWPGVSGDVGVLDGISEQMAMTHAEQEARRKKRTPAKSSSP